MAGGGGAVKEGANLQVAPAAICGDCVLRDEHRWVHTPP